MKHLFYAILAILLAACGGGSSGPNAVPQVPAQRSMAASYQVAALVNESFDLVLDPTYNTSFFDIRSASGDDPVAAMALEAAYPGDVIAVTHAINKSGPMGDFGPWIAAAAPYPNVRYFYVYDEMFWEGGAVSIGAKEDVIDGIAKQVQSAGYKSAVSIMPSVVLAPDFKLKEPNDFDVIGLDLYPQLTPPSDTGSCTYNDNPYTTMLYCSVKKLRDQGYTGQIWYITQAFEVRGNHAWFLDQLKLQQATIAVAPSFGVSGIVPYGLYMGAPISCDCVQGKGSDFESLVDLSAPAN